jgi:chemotaxis protein CheZ
MMATAALRAPRDSARSKNRLITANGATDPDVKVIVRELAAVADYIAHIKQEIGALRANELYRDRIPTAHDELGNVVQATASATHSIMKAAEDILGAEEASLDAYKARVEENVLTIFEACSFQDITGQRISKVVEALQHVEKRLSRFASAVNARDTSDGPDPEDALRQARREVLMLNGPAAEGAGVKQDDIDKLFD